MNLTTLEKISLKRNPNVTEDMIQDFLFKNPSALGLGELEPIQREKVQPSGGRLDLLLEKEDKNVTTRYEVEIQLGEVDESHIIRTIEYWDTERKRNPRYNHCAVIVAEGMAGRFLNVISLFNGAIPLIALDLAAYKNGSDIVLTFTKVLDKITLESADEAELRSEPTDRVYWETQKSTPAFLREMDKIFDSLREYVPNHNLNYTKYYIGLTKNNIANNFICFRPNKSAVNLSVSLPESLELTTEMENKGLDIYYQTSRKEYVVKFKNANAYFENKEATDELVHKAMDYYSVEV